jgi:hypothetical protein
MYASEATNKEVLFMSHVKPEISEFIKHRWSKGGSYNQNSDVSELPELPHSMTQTLLRSGLCSSVDTKRQGFVMPFWSVAGKVDNRDLGMLFDIEHSKIVVDGFKLSRIKNEIDCYATTLVWCGYGASPVPITAHTSQIDCHLSTESISTLTLKNLMELAIQSYVMQVAYNSRSSWNNAWSKTPDETMRGRFVLSLNRTTNDTTNQKIVLNTDLKNVIDNDRITKSILSVSLTSLRYDAMDDMRQLALEIITPLQDAGYEVNITTHEGNTVVNEQGYAQVLEISIDVTDDITLSSQSSISECRFLRTLESVLSKTAPSTRKPLYLLDEQRELTALEGIASSDDRISQEYHKQAMSLAEKTIRASTGRQHK